MFPIANRYRSAVPPCRALPPKATALKWRNPLNPFPSLRCHPRIRRVRACPKLARIWLNRQRNSGV